MIKNYNDGKISQEDAKNTLLKEKVVYIEAWKKRLEIEREKIKNDKYEKLRNQIKEKLDDKLKVFEKLSTERKNGLYNKVLEKIDEWLNWTKLSDKQRLLYNILRDVFSDLLE